MWGVKSQAYEGGRCGKIDNWGRGSRKKKGAGKIEALANTLAFYLAPFIPLSFKGEGEGFFKRGASAPLKHPLKQRDEDKAYEDGVEKLRIGVTAPPPVSECSSSHPDPPSKASAPQIKGRD